MRRQVLSLSPSLTTASPALAGVHDDVAVLHAAAVVAAQRHVAPRGDGGATAAARVVAGAALPLTLLQTCEGHGIAAQHSVRLVYLHVTDGVVGGGIGGLRAARGAGQVSGVAYQVWKQEVRDRSLYLLHPYHPRWTIQASPLVVVCMRACKFM